MADTLIHRLTHHTPCSNESNPTSSGSAAATEPGSSGITAGTNPDRGAGTASEITAAHDRARTSGETVGAWRFGGSDQGSAGAGICTSVDEPDIILELVMTDRALFEGANDPALLVGYDPIPASTARNWILGNTPGNHPGCGKDDGPTTANGGSQNGSSGSHGEDDSGSSSDNFGGVGGGAGHGDKGMRTAPRIWLKRLFTHPDTNALLAMDSRARLFPEGMKEFLRIQDQRCRTPWCDAPIRQYDHIKAYSAGGSTSISNGQGLCTACNQAKETPGWTTTAVEPRPIHTAGTTSTTSNAGTTSTRITTPTGHQYASTAPPLPGTSPSQPRNRANRRC
ncbi:HNH endonuclease [Arthrobacter sp. GMC3]|uniref:HNH endonuclease n=1 Tax=Arthrobacter sp. GMC3 TaxID=2058894 RepID=UPI000CE2FDA7|nr:HNH endonuclease signature motif containing protein [Arthrobacter sp. GMC3]